VPILIGLGWLRHCSPRSDATAGVRYAINVVADCAVCVRAAARKYPWLASGIWHWVMRLQAGGVVRVLRPTSRATWLDAPTMRHPLRRSTPRNHPTRMGPAPANPTTRLQRIWMGRSFEDHQKTTCGARHRAARERRGKLRRARRLVEQLNEEFARWVVWGWELETPGYPISPRKGLLTGKPSL